MRLFGQKNDDHLSHDERWERKRALPQTPTIMCGEPQVVANGFVAVGCYSFLLYTNFLLQTVL